MPERPDQSVISSPRSERVRRIAALTGRSARRKQKRFRVEGPQAIRSLLQQQPQLALELFLTPAADAEHPELAELAGAAGIRVQEVGEPVIRAMVREGPDPTVDQGPVSPQGAIAVARLPREEPAAALETLATLPASGGTTVVVLHEVRDPGNVGTLIRTADAAGAGAVILSRASADPFSPKAVRAGVGSQFHLPVLAGADISELLPALAAAEITAVATSGYARSDLFDTELPERIAWIFGNEARGLDAQTLDRAPLAVRIPLAGRAESLNVHTAATVCLFETLRRRRKDP